jgi:hypothetical protein
VDVWYRNSETAVRCSLCMVQEFKLQSYFMALEGIELFNVPAAPGVSSTGRYIFGLKSRGYRGSDLSLMDQRFFDT